MSVVTSPFTDDPNKIVKRVLRRDLAGYPFGSAPFTVGCGYAARSTSFPSGSDAGDPLKTGTLIVRLADGAGWLLPDMAASGGWAWGRPVAMTCDEIFMFASEGPALSIARVRLDSLGPPNLPPP